MDDYISRLTAIDAAIKMFNAWYGRSLLRTNEIRARFEQLPSADVQHWIPCSEQMPPMDKYVLVCTVDGDITDGQRWDEDDDGTWFIFGDSHSASDGDIVAWMPLPEPYEEGETNEQ